MTQPALCRSCFTAFDAPSRAPSCPNCGGRNCVTHDELHTLSLAHLDCDAFYAAVEKRDNPALRDKPVIVGGGVRGVVTTACYIARLSGVRSAMPMFKARKACPNAVIVKPRMEHYRTVSREIRALMLALTPAVEPISVDEAFLDLSGTQRLHGASPATMLAKLATQIETEIGITVSIGLSHNKFLAKIASDYRKPRGFFVIGAAETKTFLEPQPVRLLWGVGKAFAGKLSRDGITHLGQIQAMEEAELLASYGSMGSHIWRLANGLDARTVKPTRKAKSISSERTFNTDISAYEALSDLCWSLSEEIAASLRAKQLSAKTVHLKLKTPQFRLLSRSLTPGGRVASTHAIFNAAQSLLKVEADGQPFRLLGVGVSGLSAADASRDAKDDLFGDAPTATADKVEDVMSQIRARYGKASIETGRGLRAKTKGINKRQSLASQQKPDGETASE
ncbi:MAG: DNA polymerase IV [Pseudomonadota bacterium]